MIIICKSALARIVFSVIIYDMEDKIQQLKYKSLTWINITNPTAKEIEYLRDNFDFHPLDFEDCLSPAQRPKLDEYSHYIFMILTFPYYDRIKRRITASEVDFFIGPNYIITLNDGLLSPIINLFRQCQVNEFLREKYMENGNLQLLHELLNKLQTYCFPIIDHINHDIDEMEKIIFSGNEKKMVEEILIIKRNIVNFRNIMQAHKNIIKKLISLSNKYFIPSESIVYLANLLERTKDIWDILEGQKETIEALHNTNESLISFRLNDIMKTLTIFSVIVFPLTLLAAIFGMNIMGGMPFLNSRYGFWLIIVIMLTGCLCMLWFFKKKKWL